MVRVVALVGASQARKAVHFLNPARVLWIGEGGPAWCSVRLEGAEDALIVAEPAAHLAKRLATAGDADEQGVA